MNSPWLLIWRTQTCNIGMSVRHLNGIMIPPWLLIWRTQTRCSAPFKRKVEYYQQEIIHLYLGTYSLFLIGAHNDICGNEEGSILLWRYDIIGSVPYSKFAFIGSGIGIKSKVGENDSFDFGCDAALHAVSFLVAFLVHQHKTTTRKSYYRLTFVKLV